MKLWFVLGTAAELIKVYPVMREADARDVAWTAVSTGQSGINFWKQYDDFALPRERARSAMETGADLAESTSAFKWFMRAWRMDPQTWVSREPDRHDSTSREYVVVHGDTLSTLVGARWGRRLRWPVVHIEAGLRSSRLFSPFPEEINRRLVSRWTDFHMAPDDWAAANLRRAGYREHVIDTGANTLVDAIRLVLEDGAAHQSPGGGYALANLHRFENLSSRATWGFLVATLEKAARERPVVMVLHPQTRHKIDTEAGTRERLERSGVKLVDRLPFREFIHLLAASDFVITDGGSNQEECFYLGKPCLLLRETTERQVGLGSTSVLASFQTETVDQFLRQPSRYRQPPWRPERSPSAIILDALTPVRA